MTNLHINIKQDKFTCQESKINSILKPEQRVYLYGDPEYTGRLIRPIERTYPPKWTVELDRGGYEAVNTTQISVIESEISNHVEQNYPIPFSDEPEVSTSQLESQLQKEIIALRRENALLREENEIISKDLGRVIN